MYHSVLEIVVSLRLQRDIVRIEQGKLDARAEALGYVADALDDTISFLIERSKATNPIIE